MPICPICDDTGLMSSDSTHPEFCYCAAGKQARRQWETDQTSAKTSTAAKKVPSFIDIADLEQVNASVDAMRASLLGATSSETTIAGKHPAVQLLFRVAHPGHEISVGEANQLHDLAKTLEHFLTGLAPIGRSNKR